MSLAVRIDVGSSTPHYEQLRAQLAALITAGALADGQRLPTVRALANDLGIAPGTVARTYRDLEAGGLVLTRRKVGTVVTAPAAALERAAVTEAAERFVRLARGHGLDDGAIKDAVAAALLGDSARSTDVAALAAGTPRGPRMP